jgi:hypothetical protein
MPAGLDSCPITTRRKSVPESGDVELRSRDTSLAEQIDKPATTATSTSADKIWQELQKTFQVVARLAASWKRRIPLEV